jgi:acetyl esterase/lipase
MAEAPGMLRTLKICVTAMSAAACLVGIAPSAWATPATIRCATSATVPNLPYASADASGYRAELDVYKPAAAGVHPAVLLVHGGSWETGCKGEDGKIALGISRLGYVVFVPDYHLDCTRANPPPDVTDPRLCGYNFTSPRNSPVADILQAISFVRGHAVSYGADPSRVAALGLSSGGNLTFMASTRGTRHASAPDVVAGWSSEVEMDYQNANPAVPVCTGSDLPGACRQERILYAGCDVYAPGNGLGSACDKIWRSAAPWNTVSNAPRSPRVPAFVANAQIDFEPLKEAQDYVSKLRSLGIANRLCTVAGQHHAKNYRDLPCTGGTMTVESSTIAWFHAAGV